MNERQWWSTHVQHRLHRPNAGVLAWKMQDAFVKGRPDVLFNVPIPKTTSRLIGWLELKYDDRAPAKSSTAIDIGLTVEQLRHLDLWATATNDPRSAIVLYGVHKEWFVFPHDHRVLIPGSKWFMSDIATSAWFKGSSLAELDNFWALLTTRPRFK